jgi:hypothetical protein
VNEPCEGCPLRADLAFAQSIIVELQHIIRELRDELGNHQAAQAGWPDGETAAS